MGKEEFSVEDAKILSLDQILSIYNSLYSLPDLKENTFVYRKSITDSWTKE